MSDTMALILRGSTYMYSIIVSQKWWPISCRMDVLKWRSAYLPKSEPQKDASRVNEFMMPSSFHPTTRPVPSFDFWVLKAQSMKLNTSAYFSSMYGKILSRYLVSFLAALPYMKIFFFLECPWKSQNNKISRSSYVFLISCLMLYITGCISLVGSCHCLFRS